MLETKSQKQMEDNKEHLAKIRKQEAAYKEEFDKAARAAWNLAEYLIENPQNFMEAPWTYLSDPVKESIEFIVKRRKTAINSLSHQSIQPKSLDMDVLRAEAEEVMGTGGALSTRVSTKKPITELASVQDKADSKLQNLNSNDLELALIKEQAQERTMEERAAYYNRIRQEIAKQETKPELND